MTDLEVIEGGRGNEVSELMIHLLKEALPGVCCILLAQKYELSGKMFFLESCEKCSKF